MSLTQRDIFVLIAAYNEEAHIEGVVRRILSLGYHLHVVDDGSTDRTAEILRSLNVSHEVARPNAGKGAAIKKGFRSFLQGNHAAVVVMDADGQHLPEEIERFLQALNASGADLILGNRMHRPEGMPFIRRWTNRLMSWLISASARHPMPDTQCGFRALTRRAVQTIRIESDRFEAESEMLLQAVHSGLRIASAPVSSVYGEEGSHIHPVRDTLRFIRFFLRFHFKRR